MEGMGEKATVMVVIEKETVIWAMLEVAIMEDSLLWE